MENLNGYIWNVNGHIQNLATLTLDFKIQAYPLHLRIAFRLRLHFFRRCTNVINNVVKQNRQQLKYKKQKLKHDEERRKLQYQHQLEIEHNEKEIIRLNNVRLQTKIEQKNLE